VTSIEANGEPDAVKRRALYGRSKGKTLRAYHAKLVAESLPRLEVTPAELASGVQLFAIPTRELWLEIGFGGGEHLIARARENPDVGFIGCEPFVNGVAKLLAAIEEGGLANIRIRSDDATALIEAAPTASFSRIYLLYPDPWPKRRQNKRRFVSSEIIAAFARVLNCASPPTSTTTPVGPCDVSSHHLTSYGMRASPTIGVGPGTAGNPRVMR